MDKTLNIINKILKQAEEGKIEIKNQDGSSWKFFVKLQNNMSSRVNNNELAIVLRDMEIFSKNLREYLQVARDFYASDKDYYDLTNSSFDEKLFMDLLINATNYNLNNFEEYILERTTMIKNQDIQQGEIFLGSYLGCDIVANISKNHSNLEAPYRFNLQFKKDGESFVLPNITFGQVEDKVVVYAIQGMKEKQDNTLSKKLDRHFRKLNKDVDMEDEILSQVSANALVSVVCFMAYVQANGANKVEAINFLPVRYETQLTRGEMLVKSKGGDVEDFVKHHEHDQFNMTNRFSNTLIRYAHHFNLQADFDEITETIYLDLVNNIEVESENIIYEIYNNIRDNLMEIQTGIRVE